MNRAYLAALLLATAGFGQPVPPAPPASAAPNPTDRSVQSDQSSPLPPPLPVARAPTIEHDGQPFQLANRTATKNAETDEYVVAGETLANWTQLLTVQRLTLARAATPEEFLAYFQKRVTADGASFDVVKQSPTATVFAVRFPASDKNDEQVMICLAVLAPDAPARLNVVQYAIKPLRAPVAVVEMRLRSWKDTFLRQAEAAAAKAQ